MSSIGSSLSSASSSSKKSPSSKPLSMIFSKMSPDQPVGSSSSSSSSFSSSSSNSSPFKPPPPSSSSHSSASNSFASAKESARRLMIFEGAETCVNCSGPVCFARDRVRIVPGGNSTSIGLPLRTMEPSINVGCCVAKMSPSAVEVSFTSNRPWTSGWPSHHFLRTNSSCVLLFSFSGDG